MIWCCWHLAASFLFTVNTSHRPWSVLLLVVSILLYAAIMHMAQSFHVNKNVSFSARNLRMNLAILRGYCAELNGMWWGGEQQGVSVEGRGGFWGHLVGLTLRAVHRKLVWTFTSPAWGWEKASQLLFALLAKRCAAGCLVSAAGDFPSF